MKFMPLLPHSVSIKPKTTIKVDEDWFGDEIQVRAAGKLCGIGFYLSEEYNWTLVRDEEDLIVLIPTKKD